MFTNEERKEIFKHWSIFMEGGVVKDRIVREEVLDSWMRSKNYGVNPYILNCPILSPEELDARRVKRMNLINIASSYMANLHEFVKESKFIVVLTDEEGFVLESLGDEAILSRPESSVKGAARREDLIGSNAVGTCLYLDKPIQIWAEENYSQCYHEWTCSAAPIHDHDGKIIGCFDLSGYWNAAHSHTLGMAIAAADAIERQMRLEKTCNEISLLNNQQKATLGSISEGIIVIDLNEKIIQINKSAAKMIGQNVDTNMAKSIRDVLACDNYFAKIIEIRQEVNDAEVKFNTIHGMLNCAITATPFINDQGHTSGLVIVLREMQMVRKLVNKMTGSQAIINFDSIIGVSEKYHEVMKLAITAAKSTSSILLLGESGTGKEMFAQAIHNKSNRKHGPFIAINCGAVPRNLIESELFGYEGGAFTGSNKEGHMGKFELADEGTLFLDEIADMPLDLQVVLLRVLQNKEVIRIGGYKAKKIDVRIIAATNTDLELAIKNRTFRQDLYYRLNVFPIKIPPLRERLEDIKLLIKHFINKYNITLNKEIVGIEAEAYEILQNHIWPGNIRELENVIERAMNITQGTQILKDDLPIDISNSIKQTIPRMEYGLEKANREILLSRIKNNKGNMRKTATELGIGRSTLYRMIEKHRIDIEKYR